jgi:hypothetical protein
LKTRQAACLPALSRHEGHFLLAQCVHYLWVKVQVRAHELRSNRTTYLHPYTVPRYEGPQPIERHQLTTPTAHGAPEHQGLQNH